VASELQFACHPRVINTALGKWLIYISLPFPNGFRDQCIARGVQCRDYRNSRRKGHSRLSPGNLDLTASEAHRLGLAAATAVSDYYGHFPVSEARILIVPVEGRDGVSVEPAWETRPATSRVYLGQQGVEVPVLQQLYNEMKATAVAPDLGLLWVKLGVEIRGPGVEFDDRAPWADPPRNCD
jgi:hypothetical protein